MTKSPGSEFQFTSKELVTIHKMYDRLAGQYGIDPIMMAKIVYLNGQNFSQNEIAKRLGTYPMNVNRYLMILKGAPESDSKKFLFWAAILVLAGIVIISKYAEPKSDLEIVKKEENRG